jgi:hypothetical protein
MPSTYPLRRAGDISAIRLTRKLANEIDGVDLTDRRVGEIMYLPPPQARLLIAEGWAEPVPDVLAETTAQDAARSVAPGARLK